MVFGPFWNKNVIRHSTSTAGARREPSFSRRATLGKGKEEGGSKSLAFRGDGAPTPMFPIARRRRQQWALNPNN